MSYDVLNYKLHDWIYSQTFFKRLTLEASIRY